MQRDPWFNTQRHGMTFMTRVTLDEGEIESLKSYFDQIEIAQPLLFYQESAGRAHRSARLWDECRRYLVELDEFSLSEEVSEYILNVGFHMIYSHSIVEHLLGLMIVNEFDLDLQYIGKEDGANLSSLRIDDKLALLEMAEYDLPDNIDRYTQRRHQFAHEAQITDFFFNENNDQSTSELVSSTYAVVEQLCFLVYNQSLDAVSRIIEKTLDYRDIGPLDSEPAGSIALEYARRPDGIEPYDRDDLSGESVEALKLELRERGFEPDNYDSEELTYAPHIDLKRPVENFPLCSIVHVVSSGGLSTTHQNVLMLKLVARLHRRAAIVPFEWKVVVSIDRQRILVKRGSDFDDDGYRKRAEPVFTFELNSLPHTPTVPLEVFAMIKSETGYYVDRWQNSVVNVDWIYGKINDVERSLDLASLIGKQCFEDGVISIDSALPEIEGYLDEARNALIRANDPVHVIPKSDLPPPIVLEEDPSDEYGNEIQSFIDAIGGMNQKLKSDFEDDLFNHQFMPEHRGDSE